MWMIEQVEAEPMRAKGLERLLTGRERQIIALIAKGHSNQQIAAALGISEQTVKNKLTVIFEKLGIRGRVRLAVFALEHGLE